MSDIKTPKFKIGTEVMLRVKLLSATPINCRVNVELPNGKVMNVHLNELLPPDVKPYKSWDDHTDDS